MKQISFIKWTGSKRLYAKFIVDKFPHHIDTYYEPFLGSGSILIELLSRNYDIKNYIVSDKCRALINLWNTAKNDPDSLIITYEKLYKDFNSGDIDHRKNVFNEVRKQFNENKNLAGHFLFLTRTSINGLVRFNSKGDYNSTPHFTRPGIEPYKLKEIILNNNRLIQKVSFISEDYSRFSDVSEKDVMYLDPPYARTSTQYYGNIDTDCLFNFIKNLKCRWLLSYDGLIDGEKDINIPIAYKNIYFSKNTLSAFNKLTDKNIRKFSDALYTNFESVGIPRRLF